MSIQMSLENFLKHPNPSDKAFTHYPCKILHCFDEANRHNKLYVIGIERLIGKDDYKVVVYYGGRHRHFSSLRQEHKLVGPLSNCLAMMNSLTCEKERKGYTVVTPHSSYVDEVPGIEQLDDSEIRSLLKIYLLRDDEIINKTVTVTITKLLIVQDEFEAEVARQILG